MFILFSRGIKEIKSDTYIMQSLLSELSPDNISNIIFKYTQHPTAIIIERAFQEHEITLRCHRCSRKQKCMCKSRSCSICSIPLCNYCTGIEYIYYIRLMTEYATHISVCDRCFNSRNAPFV